jgi:hypothetical protein
MLNDKRERFHGRPLFCAAAVILAVCGWAWAADLEVDLPDGTSARGAAVLAPSSDPGQDGPAIDAGIDGRKLLFTHLQSAIPYDLRIVLRTGQILRGVNMAWYTAEPPQPDAALLDDDDRKQIGALVADVKSFYDVSRVLCLSGDHNRATVLVERIRSSAFHGSTAGEVIWRIELWYFVNEFGGWAELPQTNKVLLRSRFNSTREYHSTVDPLRWVPQIGGIILDQAASRRRIDLPADLVPATLP